MLVWIKVKQKFLFMSGHQSMNVCFSTIYFYKGRILFIAVRFKCHAHTPLHLRQWVHGCHFIFCFIVYYCHSPYRMTWVWNWTQNNINTLLSLVSRSPLREPGAADCSHRKCPPTSGTSAAVVTSESRAGICPGTHLRDIVNTFKPGM